MRQPWRFQAERNLKARHERAFSFCAGGQLGIVTRRATRGPLPRRAVQISAFSEGCSQCSSSERLRARSAISAQRCSTPADVARVGLALRAQTCHVPLERVVGLLHEPVAGRRAAEGAAHYTALVTYSAGTAPPLRSSVAITYCHRTERANSLHDGHRRPDAADAIRQRAREPPARRQLRRAATASCCKSCGTRVWSVRYPCGDRSGRGRRGADELGGLG